ncbi:MAG TPA: hypothetical protein VH369_07865 [Bryobacteraceae bacterium]|jgi:hypothetical protein
MGANFAFCPQCRTPAAGGANPAPTASAPAAVAPPAKSGSGLKILLIILCILAVGGIAVVGGLFYVAHRVKQAVVAKAHEYGVDGSHTRSSTLASIRPCDLLSKQEAAHLLGEPIERTEVHDASCMYYGPPGLSAKLGKAGMSSTLHTPGESQTAAEAADTVDRFLKSAAAQAGQIGSNGEYPLLTVLVAPGDGRAQMTAVLAGKALLSGLKGAGEEIPDLGDRAVRLGSLGLNVLKGDTLIRILPGPVPDANRKCILLARTMLPRI